MGGQEGGQPAEFKKRAVEAMQQQHRGAGAEHGHGPFRLQSRKLPPLDPGREIPALGIEQVGGCMGHQGFAGAESLEELVVVEGGLVHAATRSPLQVLTRAAIRSLGATAKGRWWRSEPLWQAKAQTSCSSLRLAPPRPRSPNSTGS